ncbi:MAG: arsenate reductase ArsC [Bacteroidetes bacterium]|nr:arsenate reductase ArsC [Bacteroidota bacterium]
MRTVLFVCIHNSARSQMAEAFLNELGKGSFMAESAGIEKGNLNALVVKSMQQAGIDISGSRTKEVAEFIKQGKTYDAVITVCDAANAERCPVFPGKTKKIAWFFEDPSALQGTEEEKLQKIALIRDEIKAAISKFIEAAGQPGYWK